MTVSRRLRFEVLRRDGHACRYCGAKAPDITLHVDHVIPTALGGGDDPTNLVTACAPCNAGKTSTAATDEIVADVDATALLFAKAIERAAAIRRHEMSNMEKALDWFHDYWQGTWEGDDVWMPDDWESSIERFLAAGLDLDELGSFVNAAARGRRRGGMDGVWRYFCACCWREITERQELARRLLEVGEV